MSASLIFAGVCAAYSGNLTLYSPSAAPNVVSGTITNYQDDGCRTQFDFAGKFFSGHHSFQDSAGTLTLTEASCSFLGQIQTDAIFRDGFEPGACDAAPVTP